MKKNIKGIFAWILMCVILIGGIMVTNKLIPPKAEAAAAKCYNFCENGNYMYSTKKRVKIGKYYYRINEYGRLQRSKSKDKNFKTILRADTADYLIFGKRIYYTEQKRDDKGVQTTIYSCKINGKSKKKILTVNEGFKLSTIYNNKLYVSRYEGTCITWSISLKGEAKLTEIKKDLCLFNQRYGQYILGAEWLPEDVSSYGLCIYDVKKNKKISLGSGMAGSFIGKKIYYASYNEKKNCYYIKKCNPDGSKKEVITKLGSTIWKVTKVTKTYCEGYSTVGKDEGGLNKVTIKY